jgi:ubiquinone/menaquinone biosynthesis C-methylase UbiE
VIAAPGITVPEDVLWGAVQWADDEGVLVVDLMPQGLSVGRILAHLNRIHPIDYAHRPFAPGVTAGVAVLVHESVLALTPCPPEAETSLNAWAQYVQSLKRFAPWESALLQIEPWVLSREEARCTEGDGLERREVAKTLFGGAFDQSRWATPILFLLIGWLCFDDPWEGILVLGAWMLQPLLILRGNGFTDQAMSYSAARPIYEFLEWLGKLGSVPSTPSDDELERLRDHYQAEIERGTERFFLPRLTLCPLCDSESLETHLLVPDLYQNKPGQFQLDRCQSCDHIFQNPQLSIEGLGFYYQDFYDGLGEQGMDLVFGASEVSYRQRVSMIRAHGSPLSWLDVGGGHGHFALIAKHLLPQTRFDVLDLSESVEIAAKRRWCDRGIRGLFPEVAPELKGMYDGISMSHYLEHTTDPVAELDAVADVLKPGGMIMIEIPDPESIIGRRLGWLWLPWFQPQHLHLLSTQNLIKLLERRGFEIAEVDRHEAHQSVDFFFAALILVQRIAPDPNQPWRRETPQKVAIISI